MDNVLHGNMEHDDVLIPNMASDEDLNANMNLGFFIEKVYFSIIAKL